MGIATSSEQFIPYLKERVFLLRSDKYRIVQIKEKFGGLRWYDDGFSKEGYEEYRDWLCKYEDLSFKTCMNCGKPAIGFTKGWITPLCKDCMKDMPYNPIEE